MVLRHPSLPEDPMAERSKTAPDCYARGRSCIPSSAPPTRIDTESRRPIEGEGNFPPFKALKSHKTRKLLPRTPRQDSPPLRDPQRRRRIDEVARDRSSFAICSNSRSRRPMGEEENFPPCKALKSLKTRKSLPGNPRRDSPPLHYSQPPHRLDELVRRLLPDRAEKVSSKSRLSYRHLSLFQPESEHAHIRRMPLQAVAL